jgi:uncharacterized protein (TIGR02145 family)
MLVPFLHSRLLILLSKYLFKITLIVLVGLLGSSCTPEYLRPTLPGKIPVVETLPNQNLVFVNGKVQLRGSCYLGEENLIEVGFIVSPISGVVENGQGTEKIVVDKNDLALLNDSEFLFNVEYSVGSIPNLTKYYRAFCKNSQGIGYGEELNFLTLTGIPEVTTSSVSMITSTGGTSGGNVTSSGAALVTARGLAFSTSQNPTTVNGSTVNGSGIGVFTSALTGLAAATLYYVRAYATNSIGTAYGNQVSFMTSGFTCGTFQVSDVENNLYTTVQIGTQCWTKSNLKTSKYRNGDNIPTGLSNSVWRDASYGAYAIYNNEPDNDGYYGKLYNHLAVTDSRGLCPIGWHVPSDAEWTTLVNHLGGSSVAGGALKSTSTNFFVGWDLPNTGATNSSNFTALPGGDRNFSGYFGFIRSFGSWWSSSVSGSNAWMRQLSYNTISVNRYTYNRTYGLSVRCIRD